jgi:hypothetical protein
MPREDHLVRRIRTEFPNLSISRSRRIEKGDDHVVVTINERLIFRFPRGRVYRRAFADELTIARRARG